MPKPSSGGAQPRWIDRFLNGIERVGNRLPDPALLFVLALVATWIASKAMAGTRFQLPTRGGTSEQAIQDLLTGPALASFLSNMVTTFTSFHPLGVVLVALLGVGVAEEAGFIDASIKKMLGFTPARLLTPMLILVALLSHTAADAGYVLVIPLGGVLFYAAGRHPLAGIAAAFAGVSGGFGANLVPSGIDPLLQGITQAAAGVLDPTVQVNPLCNWLFTAASSVVIVGLGWFLTERIVEPRLAGVAVDGDPADMPRMEAITPAEERGLRWGLSSFVVACGALAFLALPAGSSLRSAAREKLVLADGTSYEGSIVKDAEALRGTAVSLAAGADLPSGAVLVLDAPGGARAFDLAGAGLTAVAGFAAADVGDAVLLRESRRGGGTLLVPERLIASRSTIPGSLTDTSSPLMQMIVPLIFLLFLLPGVVHGFASGKFTSHRDVIKGMSRSMSTMGYYLVMAFFAALFIDAFGRSNLGAWLAIRGAEGIRAAGLPLGLTVVGIIALCATVNLLVGSASAKWALLAPIFVPMLMQLGVAPEFTQAAYRVGDSTTNIITPLMPYFPLVVAFCQRYARGTGIGTLISVMLPYTVTFFVVWTAFLLVYWMLGIPLGLQAGYTYGA